LTFEVPLNKKTVEILLTLLRGAKGIREIQEAVGGSYSTIYRRLEELRELGLIKKEYLGRLEYGKVPPDSRLIRLTEKGKERIQSITDSGIAKPLLLRKVRERWIIAVLHTLKTVSGRTRFMKLLFLLKNELRFTKRELAGFYQFRSGKYGPFSRGVMKDLEELQDDGFIKVEAKLVSLSEFNEEQEYLHIYELISEQADVVQEAVDNLPSNIVQKLGKLKVFNGMPLVELLKYVYTTYPHYIKKSTIVERVLRGQSETV